jgi:hypothetical protein
MNCTAKRMSTLVAALVLVLAACGGNTTPPYSIVTDPTLWITYPSEGDSNVCLTNNQITVNVIAQNVLPGAQVRFTLDRDVDPAHVGEPLGTLSLTAGNPGFLEGRATFTIAGTFAPVVGPHLIRGEIMNVTTRGTSHIFETRFRTRARAPGVDGGTTPCPLVDGGT